jgi:hypothetical protein
MKTDYLTYREQHLRRKLLIDASEFIDVYEWLISQEVKATVQEFSDLRLYFYAVVVVITISGED